MWQQRTQAERVWRGGKKQTDGGYLEGGGFFFSVDAELDEAGKENEGGEKRAADRRNAWLALNALFICWSEGFPFGGEAHTQHSGFTLGGGDCISFSVVTSDPGFPQVF